MSAIDGIRAGSVQHQIDCPDGFMHAGGLLHPVVCSCVFPHPARTCPGSWHMVSSP